MCQTITWRSHTYKTKRSAKEYSTEGHTANVPSVDGDTGSSREQSIRELRYKNTESKHSPVIDSVLW